MAQSQPGDVKLSKATDTIDVDYGTLAESDIIDKGQINDSTDDLVDEEPKPFRLTSWLFRRQELKPFDWNAIATRRSIFDDPGIGHMYWPKKSHESYHRFDPSARWTYAEEKKLVRTIDWKVMLWAAINFNWGNSIFRIAFLCAELPSQIISKRLGPDRWIPMQMVAWSIVTIGQFWLSGRSSFFICRALLGFIQGGFIPDLILYLSYFYTKNELPLRLALFWMSSNLCSIVASFIAFGVLRMRGVLGYEGWRWLFLIEGCITAVIGITTFFRMPPSPTQTKTWFRPKGWFTEREEIIAVNRVMRDDPSKGDMHNREGLTVKRLWTAICDYDLWPLYFIGLMFGIPTSPPSTYLTLSLRNIGFSTFQTNLLTIPSTVAGIITMFGITVVSEMVNDRSFVSMAEDLWTLPFLVAIYCLPEHPNQWMYFGLATALLSYPYTHPIQVGWASRNSGAVASRTVNASIYNMAVQASSVVASQIYRADDAPRYQRGNLILIVICCFNCIIMYPCTKAYYKWRNAQRDKIWDAMTTEEKVHYLNTTTDVGNRRLDFRFAH
ncbi:allantoate permease [Moniliophthora roreri MCA 2997]|uniref:Allantoate permease n=1 Tax=Moniliophthora roreri (strain MCA 2997) TaxID=1381753 RepID=V2YX75_MONRO|nr:allantoate permease [Moniliophthora roreri MCA 2997]